MSYKYRSRRKIKKLARNSKRNFIITLVVIAFLIYSTITWILPSFIGGISFIKDIVNPSKQPIIPSSETATLAPPVFNIPYEATNTAEIDIRGFATANSKVKLYIDDELKETVDASEDGSFTFKNISLSLGTNNIYGKTIDNANKESLPSKTIKLFYDNEKPSLVISEPEDGKKIQGGDKKIKVSGRTDSEVKVYINDNQIIVDKDGNFSIDQPLNEGDNIISVKAQDLASNSIEEQRKVTYNP